MSACRPASILSRRAALSRLARTGSLATAAALILDRTPAGSAALAALDDGASEPGPQRPRTGLGLVAYCRSLLQKLRRQQPDGGDLFAPATFLEHCHRLGAGGMQVALGQLDAAAAAQLRRDCESRSMFLEAIVGLPKAPADLERFEAEMRSASAAGARAVRCVLLPGRRYEQFRTREEFRAAEQAGRAAIERAAPVAERLRLPLAIENHKDHRDAERVRLLEAISSEQVGACLDTGNSLALLEDPLETARAFAPWAHAVHLKDQAVAADADGFLLGDTPLGTGALDLPALVAEIRRLRPDVPFCLELITRDPLRVPCLTDQYFATFPDLPASDLARTLRFVAARPQGPLPTISQLSLEEQVAVETRQVTASLDYARDTLRL